MPLNTFFEAPLKKKVITLAASALIIVAGWQVYHVITASPHPAKEIPLVRTLTVGELNTASADVYPGEVRGRYESNLAFQVSGKIIKRLISVGDTVTTGQILMELDPKDVAQVVEASNAQLASALANQKLAADNAKRFATLFAGGAVSQATLDQYNTQLEAANAAVRQAQSQVNSSANQMEYTQLRSDADGVVSALSGEVGQVAAAGTPMVTVVQKGEREVQIYVPESKLDSLTLGQAATVSFWALPNLEVQGVISEIAPMSDPITKTYRVRVSMEQLPAEAKLGMTAKVTLLQDDRQHIVIPATALYQTDSATKVWLVREGKAVLTDVTVQGYEGNNVIISQGLRQGDVIITAGISKLTPAQEVRLMKSGEAQ